MPKEEFTLKGPIESVRKVAVKPSASSDPLGWRGLHALRFNDLSNLEVHRAPLPCIHWCS